MAITNHERVGKAMELLKEGLIPSSRPRTGCGPSWGDPQLASPERAAYSEFRYLFGYLEENSP